LDKLMKLFPQTHRRLKSAPDNLENRLKVGSQAADNLLLAGFAQYQASDSSDAGSGTGSGTETLVLVNMLYCP